MSFSRQRLACGYIAHNTSSASHIAIRARSTSWDLADCSGMSFVRGPHDSVRLFKSDFVKTTAQPLTSCCEPFSGPSKFGRQNGQTKGYKNNGGSGQDQQYQSNGENPATGDKHDDSAPN